MRGLAVVVIGVGLVGSGAAIGGCGTESATPGPSTSRRIVLIESSRSAASAVAIAGGARGQAARRGYRLSVQGPATVSAAGQIAIINLVIPAKPAAVVITPDGGHALAAPLQSLRSAGIEVVEIRRPGRRPYETGVAAVLRAVHAIRRGAGPP